MELFDEVLSWFAGEPFRGVPGIPSLVLAHVALSAASLALATVVALPLAVWLGHLRRFATVSANVANAFRAVPAFGLVLLAFTLRGFSTTSLVVVFALLGLAPIFTNAYVGVAEVPDDVRDAARGMGLTGWQALRRVELPLALPVLMGGIRTSAVNIVATVPLAAVVAADNLGRPIVTGLSLGRSASARTMMLVGAALVALLSILTDVALARVQRRIVPEGLRDLARTGVPPRTVGRGRALRAT